MNRATQLLMVLAAVATAGRVGAYVLARFDQWARQPIGDRPVGGGL